MKKISSFQSFKDSKVANLHSIKGGKWIKTDCGEIDTGRGVLKYKCDLYNDETKQKHVYGTSPIVLK